MMKHSHKIFCCSLIIVLTHPVFAATCIPEDLTQPMNGLEATLPASVIASKSETIDSASIDSLSRQAQNKLADINNASDNSTAFHGLYVIGRTTQRPDISEHEDYLGLEWQLFRRGYFEGKRKIALSNARTLIDAYSLQHRLRKQSLEQMFFKVDHMQNAILAYSYHRLFAEQKQLTETLHKRMRAGYATQQVVNQEASKLNSIQDKLKLYSSLSRTNIPPKTAHLLNKIENLVLAPTAQLEQQTLSHSGLKEMQRLVKQQAALSTPNWSDNLSLGVYARRYHDYIGSQGNEIGLQVAIPVDGNLNKDTVVQHRLHLLDLQLEANKARLREQLISSIEQMHYAQDNVRQLKNEYALLITESNLNCKHLQHVVPTLENTPEKSQEQMPVKIIEKQRDILIARLAAYRQFLQVKSMVHPGPGETWYSIH